MDSVEFATSFPTLIQAGANVIV